MDSKATEARRAYMRAWRKNNPERVKAINERFWSKKAAEAEAAAAAAAEEAAGEKGVIE